MISKKYFFSKLEFTIETRLTNLDDALPTENLCILVPVSFWHLSYASILSRLLSFLGYNASKRLNIDAETAPSFGTNVVGNISTKASKSTIFVTRLALFNSNKVQI